MRIRIWRSIHPRQRRRSTLVLVPTLEDIGLPNLASDGARPSIKRESPLFVYERLTVNQRLRRMTYGVTIAGEWSNAINDCGLFVRGVETPSTFTGDCNQWSDSSGWTAGTKAGLLRVALTSMDTFRDWFFWTWKVS